MRRLKWAGSLLTVLALASPGCERQKKTDDRPLLSVVNTNDPRAAVQLTRGFYGVEGNAWRWTAKDFVVRLRRPEGGAQNGAKLQMKFAVPDVILNRLGPISLTGNVNGLALAPEPYSKSGDGAYSRDIPASALAVDPVTVEFTVDKALPPDGQDARELAIIVSSISLSPK